ncbi:MAG: hypothetical protein QOH39_2974 [Verrucomicrobiota bacterium]
MFDHISINQCGHILTVIFGAYVLLYPDKHLPIIRRSTYQAFGVLLVVCGLLLTFWDPLGTLIFGTKHQQ